MSYWYLKQRNKYGNKETIFDGRKYDSGLEAGVAKDIALLCKTGEVIKNEPQKTFGLYGKNGTRIANHRVDFLLTFKDGHQEVWEAKGMETEVWRLKREMFCDNYPDIPYMVITAKKNYFYKSKKKENRICLKSPRK